ncbi:STAS domain-containing protein [Streptomyces sp. NPDC048717]|uniref:STAS domain-containing protein n=1 Tax=Streptomyces sp. NPDC048717 TaxID=3154928 RepID=UPI003416094E
MSGTLELRLAGRPAPDEVRRLCELLAAAPPTVVVCDLAGLTGAGLAAVDVVARLRLAARRGGHRLLFWGAGPELRDVLALVGLGDLL